MTGRLAGRTAYVTGGASGIGLKIAETFAAEGARIGIIDLSPEPRAECAAVLSGAGADWTYAAADVSDAAAVDAAFTALEAEVGPAAILVNCAGIDEIAPIEDVSLDLWNRMLAVHLTGTFLACKRALPAMRAAKWGRIINLSSQLAHRGTVGMTPYCAAKAGVIGFTKALAHEAIGDGITVNCLNPGPIDTPLVASLPAEIVGAIVAQLPIARLGTTQEVATAALMLAGEDGGFFVGATLNMNGGHYMI